MAAYDLFEAYGIQPPGAPQPAAPPGEPVDLFEASGIQVGPKPKVNAAMDIAKGTASGLVQGAAGTVMLLPDLLNTAVAGPQMLGRIAADNVTKALGETPQPRGELWQPFYGSREVLEKAGVPLYDAQTPLGKLNQFAGEVVGGAAATKGVQKLESARAQAQMPKPPQATADDIKSLANQKYAEAEASKGVLRPQLIDRWAAEATKKTPQTKAGKIIAGENKVTEMAGKIQQLKGNGMSLKAAQEVDEELGDIIDGLVDRQTGILTKEGNKLLDMQTSFRRVIDNAAPSDVIGGKKGFEALKGARKLWAAQARLRDIEKIITRAEMTQNPATAIQTGFRNLASNPARMRGFSAEERRLIHKAAKTGITGDLLQIAGSRLGPVITGATGAGGLGGYAASQAASMAARGARTSVQVGKAQKVANEIANSALGRSIKPPPPKYPVTDPLAAASVATMLSQEPYR
jgi:hypothetical protein